MIRSFDYRRSLPEIETDVLAAVRRVLDSGQLILGPETAAFEAEFAAYVGAQHCIAVSSGTTALHLALLGLGVAAGDEVMTVANTCVPTVAAIRQAGARPVFVDVCDRDLLMDPDRIPDAITSRTRCLLPVHLWGQSVAMDALMAVANAAGLPVVEDCAQAHGTRYRDRHVGTFGAVGCFSFYPTKNLGAYGDAGAVVTDDADLAARLRRLRTYGYDADGRATAEGINARIGEMQAAILRVKLGVLDEWLARRRAIAGLYDRAFDGTGVRRPAPPAHTVSSYHQYVIRHDARPAIMAALKAHDIDCGIHYPIPLHRMPAYQPFAEDTALPITERAAEEILSLPIHESLTADEASLVADTVLHAL